MPAIDAPAHFTQLRDWSERKHEILKQYLPAFCIALSRQVGTGTIWYVDGYAGAGIYRDDNKPDDRGMPGSPVLAANTTHNLQYPIKCMNIEGNKENFESLQRETSSFSHVKNIQADFSTVVDQVLSEVAAMPTLFFLDPFGTKDLPMEGVIDKIALRKKPTDILLRYATETVRRLVGTYEKDSKTRDANARNLDKWFRGQEWRKIIEQHTGNSRDEALIDYYIEQLVSISNSRLNKACAYPIRSTGGITKYHLIFATGNRLGMKLMSDILFTADAKYKSEHTAYIEQKEIERRHGQLPLPLFESNDEESIHDIFAAKMARIRQSILEFGLHGQTQWKFDDLRCALIENGWFAQFSEKEFREACKGLNQEGKIKRISTGKGWARETEFELLP